MRLPFDVNPYGPRWGWSSMVVGTAHAAVLAGLLVDVRFGAMQPAMAAMVVELAPEPVSIVAPPTEIPPGPPQIESRPVEKLIPREKLPFDPPPEVEVEVPPELQLQKLVEDLPKDLLEQERLVEMTTAMPTIEAPSDERVAAAIEGASSTSSLNPEQTWESQLLATMERNKRYPGLAQQRREEDVIYVRFVVDRSGKVLESQIERSRGYALLEQEVVALLERSSPLPPPPVEVEGERVEVVVPVEFFIRRQRS